MIHPSIYLVVITLALLSGMTTIIGVALAYLCKKRCAILVVGIGFAAGIMVCVSIFELIPEAVSSEGTLPVVIILAVAVVVTAMANFFIPHRHLVSETGPKRSHMLVSSAYLLAIGLILHDFPEGFAMANSYIAAPSLGILVAIAIALHNIPEEFAMAMPLILAGRSKKTVYRFAFFSGLAEPAGALAGLLIAELFVGLNGFFLAFAAGVMIYVALHELLPMARRYGRPGLLLMGLALSGVLFYILHSFIPE